MTVASYSFSNLDKSTVSAFTVKEEGVVVVGELAFDTSTPASVVFGED